MKPRHPAQSASSSSFLSSSSLSKYSETTTTCSVAKDHDDDDAAVPRRRGLRQRARDVVSDFGAPPTARQDAKDGTPTLSLAVDLGPVAAPLSAPVKI